MMKYSEEETMIFSEENQETIYFKAVEEMTHSMVGKKTTPLLVEKDQTISLETKVMTYSVV